jgi:hypothetical protein
MLNAIGKIAVPLIAFLSAPMIVGDSGTLAAEADSGVMMKPSQIVAFDAGSRRIVGSYVVTDGQCNLSAIVTETPRDSANEAPDRALRVQATLAPGAASSIDAGAGYWLQFSCKSGAQTMMATTLNDTGASRGLEQASALPDMTEQRLAMLRATGI